jgi:hypothetical protein
MLGGSERCSYADVSSLQHLDPELTALVLEDESCFRGVGR